MKRYTYYELQHLDNDNILKVCKKYPNLFYGYKDYILHPEELKELYYKTISTRNIAIINGKGDNLTIRYLIDAYPDINILNEINMGIKVEYEHTQDYWVALDIVFDHLAEIPDYYTRLEKMELEAKDYWVDAT